MWQMQTVTFTSNLWGSRIQKSSVMLPSTTAAPTSLQISTTAGATIIMTPKPGNGATVT